jgi:hypothetical protein
MPGTRGRRQRGGQGHPRGERIPGHLEVSGQLLDAGSDQVGDEIVHAGEIAIESRRAQHDIAGHRPQRNALWAPLDEMRTRDLTDLIARCARAISRISSVVCARRRSRRLRAVVVTVMVMARAPLAPADCVHLAPAISCPPSARAARVREHGDTDRYTGIRNVRSRAFIGWVRVVGTPYFAWLVHRGLKQDRPVVGRAVGALPRGFVASYVLDG